MKARLLVSGAVALYNAMTPNGVLRTIPQTSMSGTILHFAPRKTSKLNTYFCKFGSLGPVCATGFVTERAISMVCATLNFLNREVCNE